MLSHNMRRRLTTRLSVGKDGSQVGVIEIRKVLGVELPPRRVILGQGLAQLSRLRNPVSALHERRLASNVLHQGMDVFQLLQGLPSSISFALFFLNKPQPSAHLLHQFL